ncbi:expressed unknown protein [Seminavis robusta]|uniref:Exostosin GT47 domain-containing protein n=1 Tax=Seminavis robusta TaxID=568900 RepID=A0A9N8HZN1_9STRA|nr:expressed unknown protein [Seminavis robusta]|eukprot:Sro3831_g351300.1 n/a (273) ;mRNA; r:201-1420
MSNVSSSSVIRMAASLRLETPWHHDEDSASSNETTDQQITVSFSTPAAEERLKAVDSSSLFQLPFYIYDNELDCFEHRIPAIGKPKQYQTPRVHIPSFYIGRPCPHHSNKTKDFAMIATLKPNSKLFQDRSHICDWLHKGQKHQNYTVALCGRGNQCPALGQARFGFHARGDTWGSNRLIDTLLSGAIPLITSPKQIQILPDFVPWEEVTYQVDVSSAAAFDASLQSILQKPEQELEEKLTNISKHLDIFNHKKGRQFDLYMHRFAQLLELY